MKSGCYAQLRQIVFERGLLERQPGYYAMRIGGNVALLLLGFGTLRFVDSPCFAAVAAGAMAVVFGQIGLTGHDSAHDQVLSARRNNRRLALFQFNFLVGLSLGWWEEKHGRHHAFPNDTSRDPDIAPVAVAFSDACAREAKGWVRQIIRRQTLLFVPLLLLEGFNLRYRSLGFVLCGRCRQRGIEITLIALHFTLYGVALSAFLGWRHALLFAFVHHAAMGLYLGSVFATNHVGMALLAPDDRHDLLYRQVVTARNLRDGAFVHLWYGGLNYQIEHHLFPKMPRNQLRKAAELVREFCAQHAIPYHQVGALQGYREIFTELGRLARLAREERKDAM